MPDYPYFSCSRIQTFRKCPKAFEFSYVLMMAEEFETIEKYMGSAVHELFEYLYLEMKQGRLSDENSIRRRYDEIWNTYDISAAKIVKKSYKAADYYQQGLDMALSTHDRLIKDDSSVTMYVEHQFDLILDPGRIYRGIIDRVSRRLDGTLCLSDYKTGRTVPDPRTDLQLRSYALAMFETCEDVCIEICYEDLRQGKSLRLTVDRGDCPTIRDELNQAIDEILAAKCFSASPSSLCSWCGHQPHCPEGINYLAAMEFAEHSLTCPRCGAELKRRNGKFGPFLSCGNFPSCRFSRNI